MAQMLRWLNFLAGFIALAGARGEWTLGSWRDVGRLPGGIAVAFEREVVDGDRRIRVNGVTFNAHEAVFQVIDNPPSARVSLVQALRSAGAVAGVNGNYFHEDFTPLGLTVSRRQVIHDFERAKLLSGVLAVRKGQIEMVRSPVFQKNGTIEEALQAGPWLVENGAPVKELNAARLARRTVVATDDRGNWAILTMDAVTLAEASQVLALRNLAGSWSIREALNLDGGSSTTLAALGESGPLFNIPSFGPVRNYLAIIPRQR